MRHKCGCIVRPPVESQGQGDGCVAVKAFPVATAPAAPTRPASVSEIEHEADVSWGLRAPWGCGTWRHEEGPQLLEQSPYSPWAGLTPALPPSLGLLAPLTALRCAGWTLLPPGWPLARPCPCWELAPCDSLLELVRLRLPCPWGLPGPQ